MPVSQAASPVQAPPLQLMSTMDTEDKVACGLGTGGGFVAAVGCVCLGIGALKGIAPLIVGGGVVAAAGSAVVFKVFDKES